MQICLPDDKDGYGDIHGECADIGQVNIPRFKLCFDFDVSEDLEGVGLEMPLEKIVNKTCIEVDEVGMKAAAATAVNMNGCFFLPQKKYDFVPDHLFLFLVKEYISGMVLFLGQVLDP
ncbi:unnamed protein product, partial [Brassica oleracea var. botrytis]